MGSQPKRSFIKGMSWEIISFIITTFAVYVFYGSFEESVKFSLILTGIKILFFYPHERIWKRVKWGKYNS